MEKVPNEILLKIFSYLDIQSLGRCATMSKRFHEIAYEKVLWQKLPVNLGPNVPIEFLQHIMKHGIAYIRLHHVALIGDPVYFAHQKSLKYLALDFNYYSREMQKNLLPSCTQLEKLSCIDINERDLDNVFQCIEQNSESLKCLNLAGEFDLDENMVDKLTTAINNCNKLVEFRIDFYYDLDVFQFYDLVKNLPQNLKKLCLGDTCLHVEDLKLLVVTCIKLEDLFLNINCFCNRANPTCHHFDEVISIIVESPLSETLVNLSLMKMKDMDVHEQIGAKCLELGQMKKLKKIEILCEKQKEVKDMLRENLPNLTIVEDRQQENFFTPADPYGKYDRSSGFWEINCNQLKL